MRVANDVLATSPGHAVKRGLTHQCAGGLGPRVLRSGYQHGLRRWPSFFAMFRDERARGLAVKLTRSSSIDPQDTARESVVNPPCWASETVVSLNLTVSMIPLPVGVAP